MEEGKTKQAFDRIRKDIQRQVKDDRLRKKAQTEIDRAEYIEELKDFRGKLVTETTKKKIKDVVFRFFGQTYTSLKDLIYIRYTVTEEIHDKEENFEEFLKKLLLNTNLSSYFDPNSIKITNEEAEVGDQVHYMILRQNHKWEKMKSDPIDVVGTGEDEDDGGGGGGGMGF